MGAAQAKLSEQPEIIDLLRVLKQSKLMKERQEVESLVNYLDSMENQFGEVLKELKEVKGQLTQIQDKGVKSSATRLMEGAENKIGEIGSQLKTVRKNIVKSARAAVRYRDFLFVRTVWTGSAPEDSFRTEVMFRRRGILYSSIGEVTEA